LFISIERQQNIKIFLSACKELKAKTNLKNEVIERLSVNEWLEMCQTLQSLSKKVSSQLKDTSGNFDPFTLNGNDVKKMIDVAKVPSSDNPEDQPQDYNPYESPYGDPSDDARRVSQVLSVRIKFSFELILLFIFPLPTLLSSFALISSFL
jgi:hypothetical protein